MKYQIDLQFIQKLNRLTGEILKDEAKFWGRNDQRFAVLHQRVFSKVNETSFAAMPEEDHRKFNKYFYQDEGGTIPREDVPFSGSREDQAYFFDQFRQQMQVCTYNFDRMDFLRPSFSNEKDTEAAFNGDQQELLLRGVIYPLLHGLEQREIAALDKKTATPAALDSENKNSYAGLGNRILVQGLSGQFDTVLDYAQIQEISGQETEMRRRGLQGEELVALLREYISKRFPGLNVRLDAQGKVITYLGAAGVSAAAVNPRLLSPTVPVTENLSFDQLLGELKCRQGRELQLEAINASKGTLGYAGGRFEIGENAGTFDGSVMSLDQNRQGNNAVFFVTDRQGVTASVSVDLSELRLSGNGHLNLVIYEQPAAALPDSVGPSAVTADFGGASPTGAAAETSDRVQSPTSQSMRLDHRELSRLAIPLLPLYQQLKETGEYHPAGDQAAPKQPPASVRPADLPETPGESSRETEQNPEYRLNFGVGGVNIPKRAAGVRRRSSQEHQESGTLPQPYTVNSDRSRVDPLPAKPKLTPEQLESDDTSAASASAPSPVSPGRSTGPSGADANGAQPAANPPKSMFPKIALAAGLPLAATGASITAALVQLLTTIK